MNKYYELSKNDSIEYIEIDNYVIYTDLYKNIQNSKKLIDKYSSNWDYYKKLLNKYEYVYNGNKPFINKSIKPISRSYFKLHEISIDKNIALENCHILCMAEAPGGFVKNILDRTYNTLIYANSLCSPDRSVPSWNNLITDNSRVTILNGKDNTGSLYNYDNLLNIINTIDCKKCKLITADGGIDYSSDYNNQEKNSFKLLVCEIYLALNVQINDGTFIIKFFDIFYYNSIQLLYILNLFYDKIEIVKPHTSRSSNSEKYIVCSGFISSNIKKNNFIINMLKDYIIKERKINIYVPMTFILDVYRFNKIFVDNQIINIKNTIDIIDNPKNMQSIMFENLNNAKNWYNKYNIY
jgi:23S rRNA U2552 (ribose-2'-O)-methylase RlmE/FtsJ